MAERTEIRVPDIGDFTDVPVVEVLVQAGDTVEAEQSLITLESDKATMEVPSPAAGRVVELKIGLQDTVSEGDLVAILETEAAETSADDAAGADQAQQPERQAGSAADAGGDEEAGEQEIEVRVPDIGDFADVPVIEVLVSPGDTVDADQSLITLESDKATMEVPAPAAGRVRSVELQVGAKVSEGDLVARLVASAGTNEEAVAPPPQPAATKSPERAPEKVSEPQSKAAAPKPQPPSAGERRSPPVPLTADAVMPGRVPYASPAIRAFARELGVDLFRVKGSGRKGRILREDVTAFVKSVMEGGAPAAPGLDIAPPPKIDFSKFGETELQPLSRIKKISGKNLHRNWVTVPHVTHNDEADITAMEAFRQKHKQAAKDQGFNLTPLAFLMKACVAALQRYPNFNASLDESGENLVLKRYYHLGIAVDTPDGLVVPAIRDCDSKSVMDLARELAEVSQRARDGKLTPSDWQGASFTISSLGGIGGSSFSPIINSPELGILGVSRSKMAPVWDGEAFQPRLMLPLSLSYDHRVIDGAQAARFTRALAKWLEDESNLSL